MTAPTRRVRELTYRRDEWRCVACGAAVPLEWQHRAASGMGGRGRKAPPLTPADGVTACSFCNSRFEGDLQDLALRMGWKIRRHQRLTGAEVPFYNRNLGLWLLPTAEGNAKRVSAEHAGELIEAAGGHSKRKVS